MKSVSEVAAWYKSKGEGQMTRMMMNEVEGQFIDMARGGDGSCVGNGEIRGRYYTGCSNEFFQQVCDLMGWSWQEQQTLPWGAQ